MKKISSKLKRNHKPENKSDSRITNDTVAEHREQVLGRARKYIYPLRHSKHKLVKISITILVVAFIAFFAYCTLALYKFKASSNFLYKVTQVVPFPVARIGSDFVAYENYLFEISHYVHYYRTQQDLDISSESGQQQINEFKKRALEKVVNDAYVKKLADRKGIEVTDREVQDRIAVVRAQNRLGASDKEFRSVLKDFWNWSESDFERSLKVQLLREKVISVYDTEAHDRANAALAQLKNGKDFSKLASEVSEEPVSRANGGEYGFPIEQTDRDISPAAIQALFSLKDGEHSGVIDAGYGLEIVKRLETQENGRLKAAHIVFNFKDINEYIDQVKAEQSARIYISFN